jgi:hypothetical protein
MSTAVAGRPKDSYVATTVRDFHEQLKASLLLKDDMPDLVSAAPMALNLMGLLRLLAFSNKAKTVKLTAHVQSQDLLQSGSSVDYI